MTHPNQSTPKKRIAIVGSGISGLGAAHYLQHAYDVTVFEHNYYPGGHTATKKIHVPEGEFEIDTGFIVYNEWTYPNFIRLLNELKVDSLKTDMGFSVSCEQSGLEYSGTSLSTMFAQKMRWLSPKHWRFIREIVKFNNHSKALLDANAVDEALTLGEYIKQLKLSDYFAQKYLIPMGAAIWSSGLQQMYDFPALYFLRFFKNHGLLNITDRPQWHVIKGGSKSYVDALLKNATFKLKLNQPISAIEIEDGQVIVITESISYHFDHVIMACHSEQALALLTTPTDAHTQVLGALTYQMNDVVLHTDISLLPTIKSTWSSWNYRIKHDTSSLPTLTYSMNILQNLTCDTQFCVTLNDTDAIDASKILGEYCYSHPVYNQGTLQAQGQRDLINGKHNIWFCGAYWYAGFHEDGLRSALDVVKALGVDVEIL